MFLGLKPNYFMHTSLDRAAWRAVWLLVLLGLTLSISIKFTRLKTPIIVGARRRLQQYRLLLLKDLRNNEQANYN